MKKIGVILTFVIALVCIVLMSFKTTKAPSLPLGYSTTIGSFPEGKVYLFTHGKSEYIIVSNGKTIAVAKHE